MMRGGNRPLLARAAMMHAAAQHQQQMYGGPQAQGPSCPPPVNVIGGGCPGYCFRGRFFNPPVTDYNPSMPRNCTSARDQELARQMMTVFPTAGQSDYEQVIASHPTNGLAAIATLIQIMQQRASQRQQQNGAQQQRPMGNYQNYGNGANFPPQGGMAPPQNVCIGQIPSSGRKKALLIACNYEGTANQLSGCREDSRRIHDFLTKVYGFVDRPECFLMLNDAPENKRGGREQYLPNRQNILNGMRWLVEGAGPGDCLFLHYSGHGGQTRAKHDQYEDDGKDETIYPLDYERAGMIIDDDMNEILVAHLREGVKLVVLLDCCHSGGALDLPHTFNGSDWQDSRVKTMPLADVVLISGCKSNQTSADIANNDKTGGAMTTAFLATVLPDPVSLTHDKMMKDINGCLRKRGFTQVSCLTSSQKFPPQSRLFRMDDIIANSNRPY